METLISDRPDIVLIGAGIMSATLSTVLKELDPSLTLQMFETLHDCAQESSDGWNNAGTGHAANCELNSEFDISRQLRAYLVRKGAIPDPRAFIHPCPHMSFVWGDANLAFLRRRFQEMSAPHLDTHIIGGKQSLLLGPYAGFSTKFLKHGSLDDLFATLKPDNVIPLLDVERDNVDLSEYLVGQVLQSAEHQFATLQQFYPQARRRDWKKALAGQRVQTIKPHESQGWFKHEDGALQFGTGVVSAADKSLVAPLGVPGRLDGGLHGARNFAALLRRPTTGRTGARLRAIIPTFCVELKTDAEACRRSRRHGGCAQDRKHLTSRQFVANAIKEFFMNTPVRP